MLMAEIVNCKLLRMNLMHRAARVRNCAYLVRRIFFPPIERTSNVCIYRNHPHELTMVCTSVAKSSHKIVVVWANIKSAIANRIIGRFMNTSSTIP